MAALVEGGQVNAAATFAALARATQRQTNTTRSGQYSGNQSTTILGLLSTLGSAVPELLLGRDASGTRFFESPGMQAFKSFLTQVVELLSSTSATGRRLQSIMRGLSDSVFSVFNISDKNKKGGLAGMFNSALDALEKVIAGSKVLMGWVSAFGEGFGAVFMPLMRALLPAIQSTFGLVNGGEGSAALMFFKTLGAVIAAVMWASIALPTAMWSLIGDIIDGLKWLWDAMPFWFKPLLNMFSDGNAAPPPRPPPPSLAGANGIVTAGPGQPSAARTIVSQPNVTVNVAATAANGLGLDQIASAAASSIPQVVQTSAERASTGGAAQ
ncbi:MAG: hypothetical protein JNK05_34940 [Myxococcales bacterium]|nr:hypothetical protein [Myxococcales bacterium]